MKEQQPAITEPGSTASPARHHWWRWPLRVALVVVALLLAVAGYFAWTLSRGPIVSTLAADVLGEHIAALAGSDRQVSVGVVGLELTDELEPTIVVRDVRIVHPNDLAVSLNSIEIETNWSTLLGGPRHLRSVRADRLLIQSIGPDVSLPTMAQVLEGARLLVGDLGLEYFEIAALTYRDELPGQPVLERAGNVSITAEGKDGTSVKVQAIALGSQGTMSLEAGLTLPEAGGNFKFDVHSRNFDLADIAAIVGKKDAAGGGPVAVEGSGELSADGRLVSGGSRLSFGPIRQLGDGDNELMLVPVPVNFDIAWNADRHSIELNPSPVVFVTGHLIASGEVVLPPDGAGLWRFDFALKGPDPTNVGQTAEGHFAGTYDTASAGFVVDDVHFVGAGTSFTAAVRGSSLPGGRYLVVSGISPQMPVGALKALWPRTLSSDARQWVMDNIRSGVITDAHVDFSAGNADLEAGKAGAGTIAFKFANGVFQPYDDGPLVRDAVGEGYLDGSGFTITVASGWSDMGDGRKLTLAPSRFSVPFGGTGAPQGSVEVELSGSVAAGLALWNRLPYADSVDVDFDPAKVAGQATARLRIELPLVNGVAADAINVTGHVETQGFASTQPMFGHLVKNGGVSIAIDGSEAHITGKADVDGAPADLDLHLPLDGTGVAKTAVKLVLDDAARKALGVDLGPFLSGPVTATVESTGTAKDVQAVTIDLAKAAIRLQPAGFAKPAGKPGKLMFKLQRSADGGVRISDLVLKAGTASFEGDIALDGDGLVSADLPRGAIVDGDHFATKVTRVGKGFRIAISGSAFDGQGLVNTLLRSTTGASFAVGRPLSISAAIDNVTGFNGEVLSGVNLSTELGDSGLRALSMTVQSGGAAASATITPNGRDGRLRIEAGDVGSLLRFFDIYPRVIGGRSVVAGTVEASGRITAVLDGDNWKVVEEPALARLSTASAVGPTSGLSTADIRRLAFRIAFNNGRLGIDEGFLRTDTAGLTMNGDVDFTKGVIRLAGSYLPASRLDRLLGAVPILGWTVFNGGQAGLLGLSYRLNGPIDAPDLTVNPLSAVAPGILRRLFEMK